MLEFLNSDGGNSFYPILDPLTEVYLVLKIIEIDIDLFQQNTDIEAIGINCNYKKLKFNFKQIDKLVNCFPEKFLKIRINLQILNLFFKRYCNISLIFTRLETAIMKLISLFNKNINILHMFAPIIERNILVIDYDLENVSFCKQKEVIRVKNLVKNVYNREIKDLLFYNKNELFSPYEDDCTTSFTQNLKTIYKENLNCLYVNKNCDNALFVSAVPL